LRKWSYADKRGALPPFLKLIYLRRPAVSEKRHSLTSKGNIRYLLKTPYPDGTTYVIFELLDYLARLVPLLPKPQVNLT